MGKRALSLLLTVLLAVSCIPFPTLAAEIDDSVISGESSSTVTTAKGDNLSVVFSIDAIQNVQGVQIEMSYNTTVYNYLENYTFTSFDNSTQFVNRTTNSSMIFCILFNPFSGESFSKKTSLVTFDFIAKGNVADKPITFSVKEFYDSTDMMADIDPKYITCDVKKVEEGPELSSISVTPPTKTSYYTGDTLDTTGMKVTATYADNTTKDVTAEADLVGFTSSTAGNKTITVSYGGKTATFTVTVTELAVTKIEVTTQPTKKSYYVGESLDTSGIKITATYNNGTTKDVTGSTSFTGFSSTTAGTKTVTASYGGKTTTFTVTVMAITVTKIEITTKPTKTSYYVGESFNSSGIKVTATYNNGTTKDVTSSVTYSGFSSTSAGTKNVTVSFEGKSASFAVTVVAVSVSKIEITTKPTKTSYYVGDTMDVSGIKVTATYNNGATADVTSNVTYSGFSSGTAGTKTVTVTYDGKAATFTVTVNEVALNKIEVTTMPTKTSYYVGDSLNTNGIKITATYNNGTTKDVTSSVTYSGFSSSTTGTKTVTVTYSGKTTTFNVTVNAVSVSKIEITSKPTETSYFVGDSFSSSGIKVTATYNNGTTKDVTSEVSYSGFSSTTAGTKTVTVSYGGQTATFNVTVVAVTLSKIEITTQPTKTSYYVGDSLNTNGIKVTATYNNGTTADVTSGVTYSGFSSTTAGTKTVTATYNGKTATFNVTVTAVTLTQIEITSQPTKTTYFVGDAFNASGIKVVATYNNGTTSDVTSSVSYSGFSSTTAGNKTVTASYGGKTATFTVTVNAVVVSKLDITEQLTKKSYFVGDSLNTSGIKVIATYNNGTTKDVTSEVSYSGFSSTTAGTKTVTVSYGGQTATFTVTVAQVELSKIEIITSPSKTSYYVGDSLNTSGIKVMATYNNGTTADVTNSVSYSGFSSTSAGTKTVTVSYGGKSTTFTVTVNEVTLTSIELASFPTKTTYYIGDTFISDGLKVIANYNNGTTADVTSSANVSGFSSATAGAKVITVSYNGMTAEFNAYVLEVAVESITITSEPSKKNYYVGESFDKSGMNVVAKYTNGTSENVTEYINQVNGFDSSVTGTQTVTVEFGGKMASFTVEIYPLNVDSLEITPPNKTSYFIGESLNLDGFTATAHYNNGTSKDVTEEVTLNGFESTASGTKQIIVSYEGKTAVFNVTVNEVSVSFIEVRAPQKTTYYVGEALDTTGLYVTAYYSNGLVSDVTGQAEVKDFDSRESGLKTVTVEFGGKTATFNVTIIAIDVDRIEVSAPLKRSYYVGETLDTAGLSVTAFYSNGTYGDVTNQCTIENFDSTEPGLCTVKVYFADKSTTFDVTIVSVEVERIEVTPPEKLTYYMGEKLNTNGMTVTVFYSNGQTADVTGQAEVSELDSSAPGTKTVTVSFGEKTYDISVTVLDVSVDRIEFTPPVKSVYFMGESLDTIGMNLTAYYTNGDSADITSQANVSSFDSNTPGEKTITVSFGGKTAEFTVTVLDIAVERLELTAPEKNTYFVGEALDTTGLTVIAYYTNEQSENVTDQVSITNFDSSKPGENIVEVTYGGKTVVFSVNIVEASVERIELTPPERTSYYPGEALDTTGMSVIAYYNDGKSADVTAQVTIIGFDSSTADTITVTVEYDGATAEFTATIISAEVERIEVTAPYKTSYYLGEEFDPSGLAVIAYYVNGDSADVTGQAVLSEFDSNMDGTQVITAEFEGKTASFEVYVSEAVVERIEITEPEKKEYYLGESFDPTGLAVIAFYTDGHDKDVTDVAEIVDFNSLDYGVKTITVKYNEVSVTFEITVLEVDIEYIELTPPTKNVYLKTEELDTTGLVAIAHYVNGHTADITDNVTVFYFDSTNAGTNTVYVNLNGRAPTSFDVTILDADIIGLEITPPNKTIYFVGEVADYTGLQVVACYDNGGRLDVTERANIGYADRYEAGVKQVDVEYYSHTASFEITYLDVKIASIEITPPLKTIYYTGDELDQNGLSVKAYYNDGSSRDVYSWNISGYDNLTAGVQTVTVEFEGVTATFEVTVIKSQLETLTINSLPNKTVYVVGEEADWNGLGIWATFDSGASYYVTDSVQITGFDSSKAGECTITVTYEGKSVEFTVQIEEEPILIGDVNGDGRVTNIDALMVQRYTIGLLKDPTDNQLKAMDADRNGRITAADSLKILRYNIGLVKEL